MRLKQKAQEKIDEHKKEIKRLEKIITYIDNVKEESKRRDNLADAWREKNTSVEEMERKIEAFKYEVGDKENIKL